MIMLSDDIDDDCADDFDDDIDEKFCSTQLTRTYFQSPLWKQELVPIQPQSSFW